MDTLRLWRYGKIFTGTHHQYDANDLVKDMIKDGRRRKQQKKEEEARRAEQFQKEMEATQRKIEAEQEKARIKEERERAKKEAEEKKYYADHLVIVRRRITSTMDLCITDGTFTSNGLILKAFVSFSDRDSKIFTIRTKMRLKETINSLRGTAGQEKEVVFEYMRMTFILTDEEINMLCDRENNQEHREDIVNNF